MGKSRSQISQQLVSLLNASGKLGSNSSAFESPLAAENFLNAKFTLPYASVSTLEARPDPEVQGRWDVARFRVSVAGGATTEASTSSNLASGGSPSSEHVAENLVRDLLAALNAGPGFSFVDAVAGFQGEVEEVSAERLCPHQGKTFVVVDITIAAYNATRADT